MLRYSDLFFLTRQKYPFVCRIHLHEQFDTTEVFYSEMMPDTNQFYLNLEEPIRSTFMVLRDYILSLDPLITHTIKYGSPFFSYKGRMFCYLWKDKKLNEPYIGIVEGNRIEHPLLEQGNRSRMKILRIKTNEDLPISTINEILQLSLDFYRHGVIKTKK